MGFLWRRRSSLVKIVILLSAVWFTIAFLIYSEDRGSGAAGSGAAAGASGGGSGSGGGLPIHNLPLSLKGVDFNNGVGNNNEIDADNDMNGLESVINNVIMSGNVKERAGDKNGFAYKRDIGIPGVDGKYHKGCSILCNWGIYNFEIVF